MNKIIFTVRQLKFEGIKATVISHSTVLYYLEMKTLKKLVN